MTRENPSFMEYLASHNAKRLNDLIQFTGVVSLTIIFGLNISSIYAYPLTGIVLISVILEYLGYRYRSRLMISDRIEARLLSLNRLLDYEKDQKVRFTYYTIIKRLARPNMFRQEMAWICQYNEQRSGAGRFFDVDKGVLGDVYDSHDIVVHNCFSQEDCYNMLTESQGYSEREAREQVHKRSYLAYPIVDGATNKLHGIVFFESQRPKTFPELSDQRAMNRANVDGFAVNSKDIPGDEDNPSFLKIYNATEVGDTSEIVLERGTCAKISWGEILPRGADAVVSETDADVGEGGIYISKSVPNGHNVDYNTKKIFRTCREIKGDVLTNKV